MKNLAMFFFVLFLSCTSVFAQTTEWWLIYPPCSEDQVEPKAQAPGTLSPQGGATATPTPTPAPTAEECANEVCECYIGGTTSPCKPAKPPKCVDPGVVTKKNVCQMYENGNPLVNRNTSTNPNATCKMEEKDVHQWHGKCEVNSGQNGCDFTPDPPFPHLFSSQPASCGLCWQWRGPGQGEVWCRSTSREPDNVNRSGNPCEFTAGEAGEKGAKIFKDCTFDESGECDGNCYLKEMVPDSSEPTGCKEGDILEESPCFELNL